MLSYYWFDSYIEPHEAFFFLVKRYRIILGDYKADSYIWFATQIISSIILTTVTNLSVDSPTVYPKTNNDKVIKINDPMFVITYAAYMEFRWPSGSIQKT